MSVDTSAPSPPLAGAARRATVAGIVGAGAALATGELLAGLSRRVPSLVVAVADVVISQTDAETASAANEVLGTNNKPFLVISITLLSLLFGAVAARFALRRPAVVTWVYVLFGAFGAWAASRDELASTAWGIVAALMAGIVGWVVTRQLLARATDHDADTSSLLTDAAELQSASRRRFMVGATGAGVSAIGAATLGRVLRAGNTVEAERAEVAEQLAAARPTARPVELSSPVAEVDGITPYVTPTADFYRIDTSVELPQVDPDSWRLEIDGLVERPLSLTLDDLLNDDLVDRTVTIACVSNPVGGTYAGTATWTGVPLEVLFERAGVQPDATQVVGRSVTGWTGGFPRSVVGDGRTTMVAVAMNGEPLPIKHGFPARLIVAGLYGYVSATKWLSQINLTRWEDFDGFWIDRGWAKEGPIKIASRIDVPRSGQSRPAGQVVLGGVAWSPTVGIDQVEVFIDSLDQWIPATLGDVVSDETWVQWSLGLELTPGTHIAQVRAIDTDGNVQLEGPRPPFPDGAEGYHRIRFEVI